MTNGLVQRVTELVDQEQGTPRPSGLLRLAADCVDQALNGLDVESAPCPHCRTKLFKDVIEARAFEQLSETPDKLRRAADRLEPDAEVRSASTGFSQARRQWLERGDTGRTFESDAFDLLAELVSTRSPDESENVSEIRWRARDLLHSAGIQTDVRP